MLFIFCGVLKDCVWALIALTSSVVDFIPLHGWLYILLIWVMYNFSGYNVCSVLIGKNIYVLSIPSMVHKCTNLSPFLVELHMDSHYPLKILGRTFSISLHWLQLVGFHIYIQWKRWWHFKCFGNTWYSLDWKCVQRFLVGPWERRVKQVHVGTMGSNQGPSQFIFIHTSVT